MVVIESPAEGESRQAEEQDRLPRKHSRNLLSRALEWTGQSTPTRLLTPPSRLTSFARQQ